MAATSVYIYKNKKEWLEIRLSPSGIHRVYIPGSEGLEVDEKMLYDVLREFYDKEF